MKEVLLFLIIICLSNRTDCQSIAISCDKLNILYIGVDNPLTISVENSDCSELVVKSNLGTLIGDSCTYNFNLNDVTQIGKKVLITILKKQKGKLNEIGKKEFRLKGIPKPSAAVGNINGGRITVDLLKRQSHISLYYDGFDFDINRHVERFTLSIIRSDTCFISNIENDGEKFNSKVLDALASIKIGDTVIFKNILCKELSTPIKDIAPLIFYAVEK